MIAQKSVLEKYPVFEELADSRFCCTLTNHELPAAQLENYVKTKKFLTKWEVHTILQENAEYFDEMQPGIYVCKLTKRTVAASGHALRNHLDGHRFKETLKAAEKAKAEAEEKEQENSENVAMEEAEDSVEKRDAEKSIDDDSQEMEDDSSGGSVSSVEEEKVHEKRTTPRGKKVSAVDQKAKQQSAKKRFFEKKNKDKTVSKKTKKPRLL